MVFHADEFLVSFFFRFFLFIFSSLWKDDVKTTNRCDRRATHTHHSYQSKREKKSAEINLNWQSFIYALQNPHRILFKWSRRKEDGNNGKKIFIHFLYVFFFVIILFIQWFLFSCGEWSEISHKIWAKGMQRIFDFE